MLLCRRLREHNSATAHSGFRVNNNNNNMAFNPSALQQIPAATEKYSRNVPTTIPQTCITRRWTVRMESKKR